MSPVTPSADPLAAVVAAVVASVSWPAVAVGVAVVVLLCLWGLFRRGSMADRARDDYADDLDDGGAA